MVFTLILFLLIVVFMAFFIGKNLQNVCVLWFFKTFENIPTSVLVLIAFAAGIVFCILLMLIFKLKKSFSDSSDNSVANEKGTKLAKIAKREKIEKKLKKDKNKNENKGGLLQKAEEISNSGVKENENSANKKEKM